MRKFILLLLLLFPFVAMAQTERSIEIDASSFAPVQTDAMSGVAIDKIGKEIVPCIYDIFHKNKSMVEEEF